MICRAARSAVFAHSDAYHPYNPAPILTAFSLRGQLRAVGGGPECWALLDRAGVTAGLGWDS